MRNLFAFMCACALSLVLGCSDTTGDGGNGGMAGMGGSDGTAGTGGVDSRVVETIEEMLIGRWWLDWDQAGVPDTIDGIGLPTFTADGWVNYDVRFPNIQGVTDWCRRYANWSLSDVVSEKIRFLSEMTFLIYVHKSTVTLFGTEDSL